MTVEVHEIDKEIGPPPRHIDETTTRLSAYAKAFEDAQQVRKASTLRGDLVAADMFFTVEQRLSRRLGKELKTHTLWPFLEPLTGLAGPLTARAIAVIGDPRRFPGQQCSIGHTLPPMYEPGDQCPVTATEKLTEIDGSAGGGDDLPTADAPTEIEARNGGFSDTAAETATESETLVGRCVGVMRPPRPHSGVRSLWHYAGLHVVNGQLPKRRKGTQIDWNPTLRTLALQPHGIADQIIVHRTEPYRGLYDQARTRDKYHNVARTIIAKAFLGDLLVEWKRLVEVSA